MTAAIVTATPRSAPEASSRRISPGGLRAASTSRCLDPAAVARPRYYTTCNCCSAPGTVPTAGRLNVSMTSPVPWSVPMVTWRRVDSHAERPVGAYGVPPTSSEAYCCSIT